MLTDSDDFAFLHLLWRNKKKERDAQQYARRHILAS